MSKMPPKRLQFTANCGSELVLWRSPRPKTIAITIQNLGNRDNHCPFVVQLLGPTDAVVTTRRLDQGEGAALRRGRISKVRVICGDPDEVDDEDGEDQDTRSCQGEGWLWEGAGGRIDLSTQFKVLCTRGGRNPVLVWDDDRSRAVTVVARNVGSCPWRLVVSEVDRAAERVRLAPGQTTVVRREDVFRLRVQCIDEADQCAGELSLMVDRTHKATTIRDLRMDLPCGKHRIKLYDDQEPRQLALQIWNKGTRKDCSFTVKLLNGDDEVDSAEVSPGADEKLRGDRATDIVVDCHAGPWPQSRCKIAYTIKLRQ